MLVVYYYDVYPDGTNGIFNTLKSKLIADEWIRIQGTMRYFGNDRDPLITEDNPGVWLNCPFDVSHITD